MTGSYVYLEGRGGRGRGWLGGMVDILRRLYVSMHNSNRTGTTLRIILHNPILVTALVLRFVAIALFGSMKK